MKEKLAEKELIARAQAGDTRAFDELIKKYQSRVTRVIGKRFSFDNPEDAKDVVQDSLVKAWKNIGGFKGESAFYAWFCSIAINTAKDHLRKAKRDVLLHASDIEDVEAADDVVEFQGEEDETLRLIKEAYKHPRKLTLDETLEYIERPVYMGTPEPLPRRGTRGPLPRGTQYDLHLKLQNRTRKWLVGWFHRHVRLPAAGARARRKHKK